MDVELNAEESAALQKALRSYCSDLRMEIVDTDNPGYKRELRHEREVLEGVIAKLDGAVAAHPAAAAGGTGTEVVVRWVSTWVAEAD